MNKTMQVFDNTNLGSVRVTTNENNEPLFCLADVCRILDLKNPSQVKSRLDQAGCVSIDLNELISNEGVSINTLGNSLVTFITEDNFYDCIFEKS